MKKLLATMLLSLILITSCAETGNGGAGTTDAVTTAPISIDESIEMKPAEFKILTNKPPVPTRTEPYPEEIPYIVNIPYDFAYENFEKELEEIVECKIKMPVSGKTFRIANSKEETVAEAKYESSCAVITDKNTFKSLFEKYTDVKYEDCFADDFFDKNFVVYTGIKDEILSWFIDYEYGFDAKTKTLRLHISECEPYDGWKTAKTADVKEFYHFVFIPKDAVTVNGEAVLFNQLNVELTVLLNTDIVYSND